MSDNESDDSEAPLPTFRPFTRDELANIENRILERKMAEKKKEEQRKKFIEVFTFIFNS